MPTPLMRWLLWPHLQLPPGLHVRPSQQGTPGTHLCPLGTQQALLRHTVPGGQAEVPPPQTPLVHVSPVVQALLSLQGAPLGAFCVSQMPVAGTQTITLQGSALVGQALGVPDRQVPFWQVSPTVHRSLSSHGVPFGALTATHRPSVGSQTLTLHGSVLAGHGLGLPGWQVPFWQVSFSVHGLGSSQRVPLVTGSQMPV